MAVTQLRLPRACHRCREPGFIDLRPEFARRFRVDALQRPDRLEQREAGVEEDGADVLDAMSPVEVHVAYSCHSRSKTASSAALASRRSRIRRTPAPDPRTPGPTGTAHVRTPTT